MVKIRVTCGGCGIQYTDEHGNTRHALKTAENGPFMCDAAQADRLVRLGVAAYVAAPGECQEDVANREPGEYGGNQKGHLSVKELEKWSLNDLRKLAADMGLKPEGKKKPDYIAAIMDAEVQADENNAEDDGDDDFPDLGAIDPE